jgi:flagellar hook-length control protein FliK
LLSVTPEAAANAAFQAAPQWSTRTDQSPANDLFGSLVKENAANGPVAAPSQPLRRADETAPLTNNAATNAYDTGNQPLNNDPNYNADAAPVSGANAGGGGNTDSGPASGATQPAVTTSDAPKSGTAKSSDKSSDKQSSEDASSADTTILAQQPGLAATTPIPVTVAVQLTSQPTNVPPTPPSSGGSTAPLAIAAAAIAASAQPLTGQAATTTPIKGEPTAGPGTTSTKGTAPAPQTATSGTSINQQSTPASAPPVVTAALTSAVAAAAPVTAKPTPAKSPTTTTATDGTTTTTGTTDPSATNAAAGTAQNGPLQQSAVKAEAASVAAPGSNGDSAASSAPAISTREHSPAANVVHPPADSPDAGTQAVGTFAPQLNSPTSSAAPGALTVTAATNGAVPLNGLALEIATSVKGGKSRFEIRLDPADLGRIDVRIDVDRNGQVTSHLTVEKPETLSLLRQDAPQLQRALDDAGLKTGSGGLQFSLRDQSSSSQNSGNDSSSNAQRLVIGEEDATPATVAGRTYGRSFGSSSGVDITV